MSDPAGEDSDIAEYILDVSWRCLNAPKAVVNSRFPKVASTRLGLSSLFLSLGLKFCRGLLDVVQAAKPPSFEWFEALPTEIPNKSWGIYVLILRKDGHRPGLYIGSGTSENRGVKNRILGYFRQPHPVNPSQYTRKYLEEGYSIIQCSLLVWCPIPSPGEVPRLRTIVVIIETAFASIFWAMYDCEKSYGGLDSVCPWHRDSFEWDGLCSHSPLIEGFRNNERDLDYSPEELERIAATRRDRIRRQQRDSYRIKFSKGFWWRKYYSQQHRDRIKFLAMRKYQQTYRQKAIADKTYRQKVIPNKTYRQKDIAKKTHYCATCDVSFPFRYDLARHNISQRHSKGARATYVCRPCGKSFGYKHGIERHKQSLMHIRNTTELGSVKSRIQSHLGNAFICEPCGNFFRYPSGLEAHEKTQKHLRNTTQLGSVEESCIQPLPRNIISCEPCGKFFSYVSLLRIHKKTWKHLRNTTQPGSVEESCIQPLPRKIFSCEPCGKFFSYVSLLRIHKKTQKHLRNAVQLGSVEESCIQSLPRQIFSCEPCGKFFSCTSKMRAHKKTQKHLRNAVQPRSMEEPCIQSLPGKKFSCEPCGKFFPCKSELRVHKKTRKHINLQQSMIQTGDAVENGDIAEIEDKQYKCDACNFSSFFLSNFKSHEKTMKHFINTSCQ